MSNNGSLINLCRFKNDKRLPTDKRITTKLNVTEELASLEIAESTLSDAGSYKIVATNALGQVESSCIVTVNCEYGVSCILSF